MFTEASRNEDVRRIFIRSDFVEFSESCAGGAKHGY